MKHWFIGAVAAASLLTACGNKDSAAKPDNVASAAVEIGDVTLPAIKLRAGDPAKAEEALAAMFLGSSGQGRVTFGERSVSGADATFTDVEIRIGNKEDAEGDVSEDDVLIAESLTISGLDMVDAAPSFGQMKVEAATFTPASSADEVTIQIAQWQISNPSPALSAWVGSIFGSDAPAELPEASDLSFDGFSIGNISAVPETGDEVQEFQIALIDFRGMSERGLDAMMLEGLSFRAEDAEDGTQANISLGSLQAVGLGEVIAKSVTSGLYEERSDPSELFGLLAANPGDPGYDTIRLEAFDFDAAGLKIGLPAYNADVTRDAQGRAVRSVVTPFTATVSADPEGELGGELAGQLGLLGYETLTLSGAGDSKIDHETDRIIAEADANYFELKDGFRISMGADFGGLQALYNGLAESGGEASDGRPFVLDDFLPELILHRLQLTFDDNSFMDRAFAAAAARDGGTPEELKNQATQMLGLAPVFAGSAGIDPDLVTELTSALGAFISDPGKLTLTMEPETPVTAAMLDDPAQLTKDVLGFSAVAE